MKFRDIAFEFVFCIVMGIMVGYIIGKDTNNMVYVVIGLFVGVLVGFVRFFKFVKSYK
ncbi:AtpZ/AtpI family protein [Methanocaldococcus lauensis]|nr:AtpZ/AtpI family protein [Methanocaldococcus lauensis]